VTRTYTDRNGNYHSNGKYWINDAQYVDHDPVWGDEIAAENPCGVLFDKSGNVTAVVGDVNTAILNYCFDPDGEKDFLDLLLSLGTLPSNARQEVIAAKQTIQQLGKAQEFRQHLKDKYYYNTTLKGNPKFTGEMILDDMRKYIKDLQGDAASLARKTTVALQQGVVDIKANKMAKREASRIKLRNDWKKEREYIQIAVKSLDQLKKESRKATMNYHANEYTKQNYTNNADLDGFLSLFQNFINYTFYEYIQSVKNVPVELLNFRKMVTNILADNKARGYENFPYTGLFKDPKYKYDEPNRFYPDAKKNKIITDAKNYYDALTIAENEASAEQVKAFIKGGYEKYVKEFLLSQSFIDFDLNKEFADELYDPSTPDPTEGGKRKTYKRKRRARKSRRGKKSNRRSRK
jgi:hypothetical protein